MKKDNNSYKNILVIIMCIILFFVSVTLLSIDRKYSFVENLLKKTNAMINNYFMDNIYLTNYVSSNVVTTKIKYLEYENNELKKMLNLKESNFNCTNAKVINHNPITFFKRIEINAGIKNNLTLKMPVITTEGLVGFISKLGNDTAEVNLLTNVNDNSSIIVTINNENEKISGLLNGYDKKRGLLLIENVFSNKNVKKGDVVMLSNYMNNDKYNGIYVGKVIKVTESNYGLTKNVYVKPGVNYDNLLFLCVVM